MTSLPMVFLRLDEPAGVPPARKKNLPRAGKGPRPFRCEATQREIAAQGRTHGRGRIVMHRTHGCCGDKPP